ncbi:MAG TPA: nitronate monooxygenase [Geobacteraceae bacterium]
MSCRFKTRITELFNTRLPIVAGGMQWLSNADYVAAAARAGLMGFITAGSYPELEDLRRDVRRCRELTGGLPFGVNVSMLPKLVEGEKTDLIFDLIIEEGVRFVETAGRNPEPYIHKLHQAGIKVVHKVPTVRLALKAQEVGVDAVTVVGAECGGHPGMELVGTFVQAAVAARELSIPLIVGGGVGTGAHLVAALALGAEGVIIGTRFLVAEEIWAHRSFKEKIVSARETDTTLMLQSVRHTLRALRNKTTEIVQQLEREHGEDMDISILMPYISGKVGREAYRSGDTSLGALATGQAVAFADRIEPLAEIVGRLEQEAHATLERLQNFARFQ